ncbi:MAG: hypothetical protein J6Q78_03060 [Clostridia bacterium]|nr:hypothetical protein [Clostridia bacterium]
MTKALLKKQILEVFSWLYVNRKSGKRRQGSGLIGYVLLYVIVFGYLGVTFYFLADTMGDAFISMGFGWLYLTIFSLIAIVFGVLGSVFNTYASLYRGKDNDFLLSMPIPPSKILFARLCGVYAMGLMYELVVMIPAVIKYLTVARVGVLGVVFTILIPFVLSLFVLTLSCVLGYAVAFFSSKLKNKNFVMVGLALVFIVGYFFLYTKVVNYLMDIMTDPSNVAGKIKNVLFPFYHMGLAAEGKILSMGIFTGIFIALFAITWFVLAHNFMKLATTEKGEKKKEYKEKKAKAAGYGSALLRKEFKRFIGSPTYMLNCGIGCILTVIAAVALMIKKDTVVEFTKLLAGAEGVMVLIGVAAICIIASTNYITAPSVSLEGKNIWLLQSLPVDAKDVLMAKLKLHLLLSGIPTLILSFAIIAVLGPSLMGSVLIVLSALIFVCLSAVWGLFLGLKMPNLKWTSEVVPIKQSMPVLLALFGGWAIVLAFGGVFYLLRDTLFEYPLLYLGFVDIVSAALSVVLFCWIRKKGAKIFAEL